MTKTNLRTLGEGNITINFEDEEVTLKPNLNAIQTLSRKYGGMQAVIDRLGRLDFDLVVEVIALGIALPNNPRQQKELAEKVFNAGLTDDTGSLPSRCIDYIMSLMRGGRAAPKLEDDGKEKAPGN